MSSRRRFIHHSILAAAGINTLLLSRCKDLTVQSKSEATDVFNLDEVTIESLQKMYSAGSTSAEKVTQAYLERIAAIDQAGIKLNAIIEINPDALLIAKALDAERKAGTIRGPLHGIPILIKDNINTAPKSYSRFDANHSIDTGRTSYRSVCLCTYSYCTQIGRYR